MKEMPVINTARLILERFVESDSGKVYELLKSGEISRQALFIPHPMKKEFTGDWISVHERDFRSGKSLNLALKLKENNEIIGAAGINIEPDHKRAELGYWVGVQHWNKGYATEAVKSFMDYCFTMIPLNKVFASRLGCNPASGMVLKKCGFTEEGLMKEHVFHFGKFDDLHFYGLLRKNYEELY
ncbi:MAG: GNAT family N-acetyltransferase [Candidatus Kapaibacterium sp.]